MSITKLALDRVGGFGTAIAALAFGAMAMTLAAAVAPAHEAPKATPTGSAVSLLDGLGKHHFRITTKAPLAQRFFDQGLILTYAFNHAEAVRSFEQAARHDSACAMCYWGIALALGPNINAPMADEAAAQAHAAIDKASKRAKRTSAREQAYVAALAIRYTPTPVADRAPFDRAYADAMRELARRYPEDADAATLFAEALMNLTPWDYWAKDGTPKPGTREIVAALERAIKRDPDHPGAHHYYIHAVEASPEPERALPSAERLRDLAPSAGHLVHMSAHVYLGVGRYHDASIANERAIVADETYMAQSGSEGFYPAAYYTHNMHFLAYSAAMEGRSAIALANARKLVAFVDPVTMRAVPELQWFQPTPLFVLARFGRWDEILAEPAPASDFVYAKAMWHYARGLAFAGREQLAEATAEARALDAIAASGEAKRLEIPFIYALSQIAIARGVLAAEIAGLEGKSDVQIGHLVAAVAAQDELPYMEPPYWYFPVRQFLGAAQLQAGRVAEAETTFRADLAKSPNNAWSLAGLASGLAAQGKIDASDRARAEFNTAWRHADVRLVGSRF